MKLQTHFLPLLFCFFPGYSMIAQNCGVVGSAGYKLEINDAVVGLTTNGNIWDNGLTGDGYKMKTDGSDKRLSYNAAIWVGAKDESGQTFVAGNTYSAGGSTDWYPGPLNDEGVSFDNGCVDWDRFWVVNQAEIEEHLNNILNGEDGDEIEAIYSWPGRDNPFFEEMNGFEIPESLDLAPFVDTDQDGIYDPSKGDYPQIKGDQAVWWVTNDAAGLHRNSQGPALKVEMQIMAYATQDSNDPILNQTTHYDVKLVNKSGGVLRDGLIGLWTHFSLGFDRDDYIGYDPVGMMYAYNITKCDFWNVVHDSDCQATETTYGTDIPMVGIIKTDAIQNPVSSFHVKGRGSSLPDVPDYETDEIFYNNMQGLWSDGMPMTVGGNGYDSTNADFTKFAFDGDPAMSDEWSMCSDSLDWGIYEGIMSSELPVLNDREFATASYAVIHRKGVVHPCPSIEPLREAAITIQEMSTSVKGTESQSISQFELAPNPADQWIEVDSKIPFVAATMCSLDGSRVSVDVTDKSLLDVSLLKSGMYFLMLDFGNGEVVANKIVILH